jgi:hypothetical protein
MTTLRTHVSLFAALAAATAAPAQDWFQVQPDPAPAARRFHGTAALGGDVLLFGGVDERTGTVFGDTWRYDGTNWTALPGNGPSPRSRFAIATDSVRGRVLLFGGADQAGAPLADTWAHDGSGWQPLAAAGGPAARIAAAMAFDDGRDRAVLFGGFGASAAAPFVDTWEFDGSAWLLRQPANAPTPRFGHTLTFDSARGATVLFGGFVAGQSQADRSTFEWDGTDWRQVVTATTPSAAVFPAATFFAAHGLTVLVGGTGVASQAPATWLYDGVDWQAGPPAPAGFLGRQGHSLAYDAMRESVLLFGGASIAIGGAVPRGDTWELAVQATFTPFGNGCDGGRGAPVLGARDGGVPHLGRSLVVDVGNAGPFAVVAVGTSATVHNGRALPLDLTPAGFPGCQLLVGFDDVLSATTSHGVASTRIDVPVRRDLLGVTFFVQALVLDPAAAVQGAWSNAARATIGN